MTRRGIKVRRVAPLAPTGSGSFFDLPPEAGDADVRRELLRRQREHSRRPLS